MVIVTAQAIGTLKPEMSVHGDIVKVDLGSIIIEVDKGGFKDLITDLINQAAKHQIYFQYFK